MRSVGYLKCFWFFVFSFRFIYFLLYGDKYSPAWSSVHSMHAVSTKARRGCVGLSGTRVTDTCEQPCRCREPKLGPLPSLQAYGENQGNVGDYLDYLF